MPAGVHYICACHSNTFMVWAISHLFSTILLLKVIDGMGLGPDGPPLPPSYLFSVVNYPQLLRSHQENVSNHFEFVASSPDDP